MIASRTPRMTPGPSPMRMPDGRKLTLIVTRKNRVIVEPQIPAGFDETTNRALWRFCYREGSSTRTFTAPDWREAYREADRLHEEWKQDAAALATPANNGQRRMSELLDLYIRRIEAKKSVGAAREDRDRLTKRVRPYFVDHLQDPPVASITAEHIEAWMEQYATLGAHGEPLADESKRKLVILVNQLFRWAVKRGFTAASPVDLEEEHGVEVKKVGELKRDGRAGDQRVSKRLPVELVQKIVAQVEKQWGEDDPGAAMALMLAAYCGFRREELVHLQRQGVELDGQIIRVLPVEKCSCRECRRNKRPFWRGKSEAALRPAVVPPEIVTAFRTYLAKRDAQCPGSTGWLVPAWGGRGAPICGQRHVVWAYDDFVDALDALGLGDADYHFHDLRGSAYSALIERRGINPLAVQIAVGHSLPKLQRTYLHLTDDLATFYQSATGRKSQRPKVRTA